MRFTLLLILTILFASPACLAQTKMVKMKTINESYTGNSKRKLAHGQGEAKGIDHYQGKFKAGWPHGEGTYTWTKERKSYKGEWQKGVMHGEGTLTCIDNDSIVKGFWEKGTYIGKYKTPYKVLDRSTKVSDVTVKKYDETVKNVRLYLKEDENFVNNPIFNIIVKEGGYQNAKNYRDFVELENVTYPLTVLVKSGSEFVNVTLYQEFMWQVTMHITNIKGLNQ